MRTMIQNQLDRGAHGYDFREGQLCQHRLPSRRAYRKQKFKLRHYQVVSHFLS
jgi:hypothetical protein